MFGKNSQHEQIVTMLHYHNQQLGELNGELNITRAELDSAVRMLELLLQYAQKQSNTNGSQHTKQTAKLGSVKPAKASKSPKATKDITKTLRAVRKALGMRQTDVAKGIGMGASTVKDIEKGYRKPTVEQIKKLEKVLGVEL